MSEKTFRSTPFVTPDSIRQKLHLDKSFFEQHTKKSVGREDIEGSQYVGTIENFGSEMLLESRKMRMLRPPLNSIIRNHVVDYFLDLQYADEVETYAQPNMIVGVLKKDVINRNTSDPDKRYPKLTFYNVHTVSVIRARNHSDDTVIRSYYLATDQPPVLQYPDEEPMELIVQDHQRGSITYYVGATTSVEEEEFSSYNGSHYRITLDESYEDLPIMWFCSSTYNEYPYLKMLNNVDKHEKPLLEIGRDGHGNHYLYPFAYGEDNLPVWDGSEGINWQIRVYSRNHLFSLINPAINMNTDISRIQFIRYAGNFVDAPIVLHEIEIGNDPDIHVVLNDALDWNFRTCHRGEYRYSELVYKNEVYAYINDIETIFASNIAVEPNNSMLGLCKVIFNDSYFYDMEGELENAVTGVYVDYTSDYSDHSVSKKYGTPYELGDVGGLPDYYQYTTDENIRHPRVSMYTIRDNVNKFNQKIHDKQFAALLIDGALPRTVKNTDTSSLESLIKYSLDPRDERTYYTIREVESPVNVMSDVAYVPPDTELYRQLLEENGWPLGTVIFADTTIPAYQKLQYQFIYHGKRVFSTEYVESDPYNEIARVYYVNNDPVDYENNAVAKYPKPGITLARICDIPTDFSQLSHITGISPTFVFDMDYVRSLCDYTSNDQERIWNLNRNAFHVTKLIDDKRCFIANRSDILDDLFDSSYLMSHYSRKYNLNTYLDLSNMDQLGEFTNDTHCAEGYRFAIRDGGTSHYVGEILSIFIGGKAIDFKVTRVDSGRIIGIEGYNNGSIQVHYANIGNGVFTASKKINSGDPMVVKLILSESLQMQLTPKGGRFLQTLFCLKWDDYGNILIYEYDSTTNTWNQAGQASGPTYVDNKYDISGSDSDLEKMLGIGTSVEGTLYDLGDRDINNVIMYNTTYEVHTAYDIADDITIVDGSSSDIPITSHTYPFDTEDLHDIDENTLDFSEKVDEFQLNKPGEYYVMKRYSDTVHELYQYHLNRVHIDGDINSGSLMFPKYHACVIPYFVPEASRLSYIDYHSAQPELAIYNPLQTSHITYYPTACDFYYELYDDITFMDLYRVADDGTKVSDLVSDGNNVFAYNRVLTDNVYKFDFYKIPRHLEKINALLNSNNAPALLNYIRTMFGSDALPMLYRNTDYAFSVNMLKNYIYTNASYDIPYSQSVQANDQFTRKIRNQGDVVFTSSSSGYLTPIGEQPTGEYHTVTTKTFHRQHIIDGNIENASPLFILRLEYDANIRKLDKFRMIDNSTGKDISQYVLLIYNKEFYIFHNDRWAKVSRS